MSLLGSALHGMTRTRLKKILIWFWPLFESVATPRIFFLSPPAANIIPFSSFWYVCEGRRTFGCTCVWFRNSNGIYPEGWFVTSYEYGDSQNFKGHGQHCCLIFWTGSGFKVRSMLRNIRLADLGLLSFCLIKGIIQCGSEGTVVRSWSTDQTYAAMKMVFGFVSLALFSVSQNVLLIIVPEVFGL